MTNQYPIHDFIENRRKRLNMRRSELARMCGFKNVDKGIRRIESVCRGDLGSPAAKMVLGALPTALNIDKATVEIAIRETADIITDAQRCAAAKREAAWRASFIPHAYLIGTKTRPSQITIYGLTGGAERWLKIPLDLSQPVTFVAQAVSVAKRTPLAPFHGPTTGFIVNYTPDSAVRFDLGGNPIEHLDRAYVPGQFERDEIALRVKKAVYQQDNELNAIKSYVSNVEAAVEFQKNGPVRDAIPDDVKLLVWSRDGGACKRCGSREKLHFDHVIPVAKGGSNIADNIQILCETCNLRKSDKIAF